MTSERYHITEKEAHTQNQDEKLIFPQETISVLIYI